MTGGDSVFAGSIPALYHERLGPMLFEPYAWDIARRAGALKPARILETAAGTGIVTGAMLKEAPRAEIVATDLNQAMLDVAARRLMSWRIAFQAADAQQLPFEDESFDAVVCQFGAMFFPDRIAAYREARRVLKPGGRFLFNVWDSLAANPVSAAAADAVAALFPDDPPRFLQRVPFGYHDQERIDGHLRAAGFTEIDSETVAKTSRVDAAAAAQGLCQGSPLRAEIEARDPGRLDEATAAVAAALAPYDGEEAGMSAILFSAG